MKTHVLNLFSAACIIFIPIQLFAEEEKTTSEKLNKEEQDLPFRVKQMKELLAIVPSQLTEQQRKDITITQWPKTLGALFHGRQKTTTIKITNQEDHLKALASIPERLMKGYKIGTTIEVDGWFYSCIVEEDIKEIKDIHWFHTVATKKNESFLQFSYTW